MHALNRQDEEASSVGPISRRLAIPPTIPVHFGAPGRVLAGVYHAGRTDAVRDAAVVIFNPFGWEALASQRALRLLADRLAELGFAVLRFDYAGTGDSSGHDGDPDRLAAWLESGQFAVAEAQRLSGRSKVALVGLQFGATLAASVALELGGVASVVLWAPFAKGRALVREAKAYRALNDFSDGFPRAEDNGGIEAAGFLISAETLEQIGGLDLLADARAPAPKALLIGRDAVGTELPLLKHLRAAGVNVTHRVGTGYKDLMQEPRKAVVPQAEFDTIVAFLDDSHAPSGHPQLAPRSRTSTVDIDLGEVRVRETALCFGPDASLYGVLTEPAEAHGAEPVVLFLTTASHHRTGPNRMYVPMARELARRGFSSFRFDLSGVGDSQAAPGLAEGQIYSKAFVRDVRAALDFLQNSFGANRFLTIGLCSGAYLSFHSSLADTRIAGAVMINPQSFNWREGDSLDVNNLRGSRFYKEAALEAKTWRRVWRGEVDVKNIARTLVGRAQERVSIEAKRALSSVGLVREEGFVDIADAFQRLNARGTRVYLIYGAYDQGLDYLKTQVGSRLRRLQKHELFELDVLEGPDHTFSQLWAQAKLRSLVANHIERHFGDAPRSRH